jgi:hypothetical protein
MPHIIGRRLADFYEPGGKTLPAAERSLLEAVAAGETCRLHLNQVHLDGALVSPNIPASAAGSAIRADFVRFLLLGGDDDAPVHENGVLLSNAWIKGLLDLNECEAKRSLDLRDSVADSGIRLTDASLVNFALSGCVVRQLGTDYLGDHAIFGERVKASGAVFICEGSHLLGELRMQAADIKGDLDLSGSRFNASSGVAIDLTAAKIGGDLELNSFYDGALPHLDDPAYQPRIKNRFEACGRVLLDNATIDVRFRLIGASIVYASDEDRTKANAVLSCVGTTVKGGFFFHNIVSRGGADPRRGIESVSLLGAKVGTLVDDLPSWRSGEKRHRFDGFVYDRIADESRIVDRSAWLKMQRPADLGEGDDPAIGGLREQPWRQAASVLEASGDVETARRLRIEQQTLKTKSGGFGRKFWALPWGVVSGYGFSIRRLVAITAALWLLSTWACYRLAETGQIYAASEGTFANGTQHDQKSYRTCFTDPESTVYLMGSRKVLAYCAKFKAPNYAPFYPLLYSVDNLVPVIDLGQKKAWTWSLRQATAWILLLEYIWGVFIGSALVALAGSYLLRKPD